MLSLTSAEHFYYEEFSITFLLMLSAFSPHRLSFLTIKLGSRSRSVSLLWWWRKHSSSVCHCVWERCSLTRSSPLHLVPCSIFDNSPARRVQRQHASPQQLHICQAFTAHSPSHNVVGSFQHKSWRLHSWKKPSFGYTILLPKFLFHLILEGKCRLHPFIRITCVWCIRNVHSTQIH